MITAKIDEKGRIAIPKAVQERNGLKPGDTVFIEENNEDNVIHLAKAINPFDGLAEYAIQEYHAGRTQNIRDVAAELGIDLNDE